MARSATDTFAENTGSVASQEVYNYDSNGNIAQVSITTFGFSGSFVQTSTTATASTQRVCK